jgi:hypothetical protein
LKSFTIVEMKAESSLLAQNDSVVTPDAFVLDPDPELPQAARTMPHAARPAMARIRRLL